MKGCCQQENGAEDGFNLNKHIKFYYEDSEVSEFIDSLEEFERDDWRLLKMRQKSRQKKKSSSFAKKKLGVAPENCIDSPKSGNGLKKKYQVCSTHRRAASQPLVRDDVWSGDEGEGGKHEGGGRQAQSLEIGGTQGLGIGFFMGDNEELVADSRVRGEGGSRNTLKVLAAKRELGIQNKISVSHSMNEGGIIEKLVLLEDVVVNIKAKRGESRVV